MRSLLVISAGLSQPSSSRKLADRLAEATRAKTCARGEGTQVNVIEIRDLAGELATAMTDWSAQTPLLAKAKHLVAHADGLIAVTPVFQGSYSGLFKMFFDTLEPGALDGLPTIIAATAGSSRHSLILDYALRPLFNYLHASVVPTGVFQAAEDFGTPEGDRIAARIERSANQLADQIVAPRDRVTGIAEDFSNQGGRPATALSKDSFIPLEKLLNGYEK
ncbi:FMN reductase [Corynebacterium tuberculostearicum]|uniref:FMN reductase n=1 Tax=Corynebacterium tuberculostearicum TaxID=38304 RepID=UPI0026493697|nr:FMN reductase [Corynebacterium tuberculostearicum]WKE57868.1 FMN reductase [Corynebacterium tuberculostearicum]WKE59372.1 FMN reductase [Corynebacterium tuberculostearicum]